MFNLKVFDYLSEFIFAVKDFHFTPAIFPLRRIDYQALVKYSFFNLHFISPHRTDIIFSDKVHVFQPHDAESHFWPVQASSSCGRPPQRKVTIPYDEESRFWPGQDSSSCGKPPQSKITFPHNEESRFLSIMIL